MLISEIKNAFDVRFKREFFKRGLKQQPTFSPKEFALDVSEAQQDIQRRLKVVITATNVTLSSGTNAYSLPTSFGSDSFAIYKGGKLTKIDVEDFYMSAPAEGHPTQYAILTNDSTPALLVHPKPTETGTINLVYYPDTRYYQPSASNDQDWGTFTGSTFSGKLLLPDRYDKAVLLYLMSLWFDDYKIKYEEEMARLNVTKMQVPHINRSYKIAGIPIVRVTAGTSNNSATGEITAESVNKGNADRVIVFRITDSDATGTIVYRGGFDESTVTMTKSGNVITVTSSSSQFTNYTLVTTGFPYYQTGNNTITIETDSNPTFGGLIVRIESWITS